MFDYNGKVALVTGGGSGIGKETAALLASCGASLVVADFDRSAGEETVQQLTNGGANAIFVKVDVSDLSAVEMMIAETPW